MEIPGPHIAPAASIRVLAMMEARTVTGPAKNLIAFAAQARTLAGYGVPGIDFSVATFERPSSSSGPFCEALREQGVPYAVIAEKHAGDIGVVSQLRRIVAAKRPDIIQTHNTKSHFLIRTMGTPRGTRWIAFHHGFTKTDWKDRAYNRFARWSLKGAPHIVTVCHAFAQELEAAGIAGDRISICHNSVSPSAAPRAEELAALKISLGIPRDASVILAAGRLSKEKGHRDLVSAVALLRTAHPSLDFRLLILGEGPERQALTETASTLGVAELLLLPGQQKNIRPFYGIASVFVLPSHSEGSPNVLLEAMAARLPIAATAVGGSVELVADGETALLATARDPQSLGSAIERLLFDRALADRLAANAEAASRQYTPESYARSVIELYQRVLNRG
jgi:glycosyltransferase involved in cell wall biosynthesis